MYQYSRRRRKSEKKKKIGTMDIILIVLGVATLLFTLKMIQLFQIYGAVPDTLIERYYTTVVGEAGIMGAISAFKIKYEQKKLDDEDEEKKEKESEEAEG